MAGRALTLRHRSVGITFQNKRRPKRIGGRSTKAPPARRPVRYRQAKIIPSIETSNETIADSESDLDPTTAHEIDEHRRVERSRLEKAASSGGNRSTTATDHGRERVKIEQPPSPEVGSEYNPSEPHETSETKDIHLVARRRKQARVSVAASSSSTDSSSTISDRNLRDNPKQGPSQAARNIPPSAPYPNQLGNSSAPTDQQVLKWVRIGDVAASNPAHGPDWVRQNNERHETGERSSRGLHGHASHPVPGISETPTNQQVESIISDVPNLLDCRNERNGLDGGSSIDKQPAVDPSQKCQACVKFRRNCDQAEPSCGACTRLKMRCVPPPTRRQPLASDFSGLQLWEKCQTCAGLRKQCTFAEGDEECQNCKKRGWRCRPQGAPKPKKRQPSQGRNQDVNKKCHACVKYKSHCDGAKPRCGHCAKWCYRCFPPGVEVPKKVPKDEKCKRCRQLKLSCSESLPCPRCIEKGIECGMTSKEEEMQKVFFGDH